MSQDELCQHLSCPLIARHEHHLAGWVHYVDLRGTLSNKLLDYKDWWANELHPTGGLWGSKDGFGEIASKFAAVLAQLP